MVVSLRIFGLEVQEAHTTLTLRSELRIISKQFCLLALTHLAFPRRIDAEYHIDTVIKEGGFMYEKSKSMEVCMGDGSFKLVTEYNSAHLPGW